MIQELQWLIDISVKVLGVVAISFAFFQLREVIKKRHIDMYWKIAEIYYSDEQRQARKDVDKIKGFIRELKAQSISDAEIIKRYNEEYHLAVNEDNDKVDRSILNRIRFLNQTGVLISKNLIDKDLLFGLVGAGLEIDYPVLDIVLQAHRNEHKMPYMYSDLSTIWSAYQSWREKRSLEN
ncbi:hypothetical protein GS399_11020 [Pedobacter sp. HMF7647]|uniref:DUF4760 domain-containing protein n=1 Tax=Hufsiella arboris TaxID=2695275 RepID=A0A7K1YAA7_9SPHI|nr:hypothetical protein [Hufsiella arboris]MXV51502.1 hypothetical protein [Hufsiella arboris]